jgi:hypothetical protein
MWQKQPTFFEPLIRSRAHEATEWNWIPDEILSEPADNSVVPAFEFLRRIIELGPYSSLRERWSPIPSFLNGVSGST